jgi:plastocyanin
MKLAWIAIALAAAALVGAACGGGGGGGRTTTDSITMIDNEFQPSDFTAASDSVAVMNDGQALHNLTLSDAGLDEDVQPGQSADVDLSALDPGTYDFDCKYHPEMTGSVTVQ